MMPVKTKTNEIYEFGSVLTSLKPFKRLLSEHEYFH